MLPNTCVPLSEFVPPLEPRQARGAEVREEQAWTVLKTLTAPRKGHNETPKRYLMELERWSCRVLAETRKELRGKADASPLRRRWHGFDLTIEKGRR